MIKYTNQLYVLHTPLLYLNYLSYTHLHSDFYFITIININNSPINKNIHLLNTSKKHLHLDHKNIHHFFTQAYTTLSFISNMYIVKLIPNK